MAKISVVCDTMVEVQMLFDEFQKEKLADIDRVRNKEMKILMKSGDVITFYNGSDKMATLGLTNAVDEKEFRTRFGLEVSDRRDNVLNSVNRQYKNMGQVSDW